MLLFYACGGAPGEAGPGKASGPASGPAMGGCSIEGAPGPSGAGCPPPGKAASSSVLSGGCSPVGMKKKLPTIIEESAVLFDHICVSGGCVGCNIAVNPEALAEYLGATFTDIIK